jgi:hypothetical protein
MDETTMAAEAEPRPAWMDWKARGSARRAPRQGGGAVYGLGMIGALVYFLGTAETAREYALAVGKAMVWPALLVYLAFRKLGG